MIDETTEEGKALAQKIVEMTPYFDLVLDDASEVVDVVENPQLKADWIAQIEHEKQNEPPSRQDRLEAIESALLAVIFRGDIDV